MKGKVWLMNVWASWCVSCRQEHPLLMEISRAKISAPNRHRLQGPARGCPAHTGPGRGPLRHDGGKTRTVASASTTASTGVPETYLIDKEGVIRYKQIGAITPNSMEKKIMPLVARRFEVTRLAFFLVALLACGWALAKEAAPLAENETVEKRMIAITEELRCLVCQNESLAGSRAELAEDLRARCEA